MRRRMADCDGWGNAIAAARRTTARTVDTLIPENTRSPAANGRLASHCRRNVPIFSVNGMRRTAKDEHAVGPKIDILHLEFRCLSGQQPVCKQAEN